MLAGEPKCQELDSGLRPFIQRYNLITPWF